MQTLHFTTLRRRTVLLTLLLLLVALPAAAQWSLGPYSSLPGPSSGPLRASGSVKSFAFVSKVGGVAFAAVAHPGPGLVGQPVEMHYDPSRPDGQRLVLKVDGEAVAAEIPDWQLIPIARYADSRYTACVSLFGDNLSERMYDVVYHAALEDELLGLRLFQADVLLMDLDETWRLPAYRGQVVLGQGETRPEDLDVEAMIRIAEALDAAEYQSWVLTDEGETISARVGDGRLQFTGEPYFYVWRTDRSPIAAQLRRVEAMEPSIDAKLARYNRLVDRHNEMLKREELTTELLELRGELDRLGAEIDTYNRLIDEINDFTPEVETVPATGTLKRRRDELQAFNPAVMEAATRTARFAAFFRWLKREHPAVWTGFLKELRGVETRPEVDTPTRWPKLGAS